MVEENLITEEMEKCFNDPNEPVMFSAKVVKLSRFNIQQARTLVLSGDHIYLFEKNKLNRRHRLTNMAAYIKSTVSNEVVLSFPNAKDLRVKGLTAEQVVMLLSLIQLRYVNKCPEKTLMIFGVPEDNLREFSQDNKKYGFVNLPEDKYRLRNEEMTGTADEENKEEDDE